MSPPPGAAAAEVGARAPAAAADGAVAAAAEVAGRTGQLAHRSRDATGRRLLALADLLAAACAILFAFSLGEGQPRAPVICAVPLVVLVAKVMGLYDREDLLVRKSTLEEAPRLFQLATLYALLVWLVHAFISSDVHTLRDLLFLWLALFALLLVLRTGARGAARLLTSTERCFVIGDRASIERIEQKLARRGSLHATVVGHLETARRTDGSARGLPADELEALIAAHRADRVVVTHGWGDEREVAELVYRISCLGVKVSVLPSVLEVVGSAVEFDDIEGLPLLAVRRLGLSRSSRAVKRAFDLSLCALALPLVLPLAGAIALAIKLDSPGPVLFRQRRIGRDGKPFEMYKFRTMVRDAEAQKPRLRHLNEAGGLFKIAGDPRITRVGRLLRRSALDELPQLLNVARGEMSLVGPRPLVAEEDQLIEGWHRRRLQLTPGMTGHWQVLGSARVPIGEMVRIDYLYVTNWSLWLDVKIVLRTVPYVLGRRGQ